MGEVSQPANAPGPWQPYHAVCRCQLMSRCFGARYTCVFSFPWYPGVDNAALAPGGVFNMTTAVEAVTSATQLRCPSPSYQGPRTPANLTMIFDEDIAMVNLLGSAPPVVEFLGSLRRLVLL